MTTVWDLGVRLFHWLLVGAVVVAAFTGFFGPRNALSFHIAAGAAVAGLVAGRVVWGFTGSTYARFSSFLFTPSAIVAHVRGLLASRHARYLGHNPLGGLMVFALLAVLALLVATGVVTLGGFDKQGPLAFAISYSAGTTSFSIHKTLAYLLALMIALHLMGVAYESIAGDNGLLTAMISGQKTASADVRPASPAIAHTLGAGIAVFLLLAGATYGTLASSARPAFGVPVGALDPAYARECSACHMPYPPSLSPRSRWTAVMADLGSHFGEDASLDPKIAAQIQAYLSDNSAEKWDTRASREFAASNPDDPLRLTATPFWTAMHRRIAPSVFKSRSVGAKSACNACHSDALTGRFDPQNINIPEQAFR